MPTGASQGGFPTGGSGPTPSITTDLVQSSPGNPLVLNGQTALTAQVAGVTVLNLLAGSVTSAQPMVVPSIGENLTDQHSIPTGTADLVAADSTKFGCQIVIATLPFTGSWTAGDWAGPVSAATGPQGGSGTISAVINHGPGTLSDFRLQARNTAPSNLNVTVYKSAGGSPSYSATAAIIPVLSGEQAGSYANGISVADNDQLIVTTDTDWSGSGMTLTAWYTPT